MKLLNVAFYRFVPLSPAQSGAGPELEELRASILKRISTFGAAEGLLGTLLLAPEGVNASICGEESQVRRTLEFLRRMEGFSLPENRGEPFELKESWSETQPFQRLLIKIKKELIPSPGASLEEGPRIGKRISPRELKQWLDENRNFLLLDTRNRYEVSSGTFRGALHLNLDHFRHFEGALASLPEAEKKKPMVMFCTGGIRCEKAALSAARQGVRELYQLDGGILRYFEECGAEHFEGDCFVFDDRLVVGADLSCQGSVQCLQCQTPYISRESSRESSGHCPVCDRAP